MNFLLRQDFKACKNVQRTKQTQTKMLRYGIAYFVLFALLGCTGVDYETTSTEDTGPPLSIDRSLRPTLSNDVGPRVDTAPPSRDTNIDDA